MQVKKLKLLVTGANGQLGQCLRELAPNEPHDFIFTDIAELDISDSASVRTILEQHMPDFVINCAAYTAVDKAESEVDLARKLNADAVRVLAEESSRVNAGLVQISTDYVFKGDNPEPRVEDDPTSPVSVYGITKLEGEEFAQINPKHIILRTSWLYSVYGNNFVKTMQRLGRERREIGVVSDQWGSPTSAHDLAKAILVVVENPIYGIYHFSNLGTTNWAIFAEQVMKLSKLDCKVNHINTYQYPTPAKRPEYSLMSKDKFSIIFGMRIPEWEISLEDVISKLL